MQGRAGWPVRAAVLVAAVVSVGLLAGAPHVSAATGKAGVPTGVAAAARDHGALVSWTPPSSDGGSPVTAYVITASPGGATVRTAAVTSFLVGGLTDGTAYTFTVAAVNASGKGPASSPSLAVTPTAPTVPGVPGSVTAVAGFKQATVTWAAPKSDGGLPITGYRISTSPATSAVTVAGSARSAVVAGLADGIGYTVLVAAVNDVGTGRAVPSGSVIPQITVPDAPAGVTVAAAGSGVKVGWHPPTADGGSAVSGYVIAVTGTATTVTAGATARSVTITGLTAGTSYTFTVAAENAQGQGPVATSTPVTAGATAGAQTVVLSKASMATLTQVGTDGSLVFTNPTSQVKGLAAGDVVAAGVSTATPDGLLAQVTSMTSAGSAVTVATAPASLDQALAAGGFGASTALTNGQVTAFTPAHRGVRLLPAGKVPASAAPGSIGVGVDVDLYNDNHGAHVTVNGSLTLTPQLSFAASITCCTHTSSQFTGTVTAAESLELSAQLSHDIAGGIELGKFTFAPITVTVAGVPVVIVPVLTLKLMANGTVSIGTVTAGSTLTVGASVSTSDATVSAKPIYHLTNSFTPPTIDEPFSASIGPQAELDTLIDGLPGPSLTDSLELPKLTVDPLHDPWWTLSGENTLALSYELSLLHHDFVSFSKTLSDISFPLLQSVDPYQEATITPNPAAVAPGGQLQLAAHVAGVISQAVTWEVPAGAGTITTGGLYTAPITPGTYLISATQHASGLKPEAIGIIGIRVGHQPPGPPTSPAATSASYGTARITWTPPADTGGGTITGYTITASPGGQTKQAAGTATGATMTGLTPGASYIFTVTATSDGGTSVPSPATSPLVIDNTGGSGTWRPAIEVPGTAALNTGGDAQVISVSCASPGNCAAGGYYFENPSEQAFVVSEVKGTWGQAIKVPGTSGEAEVFSVSCPSAGNCTAGGGFAGRANPAGKAFVVSEVNGTWGQAIEVPGTAALNTLGQAQVNSVSCASAGNCTAGGFYSGDTGQQAFVASEVNGTWGQAIEVPGTAALNAGENAQVTSVSCASAGNCAAGGYYYADSSSNEAFVVSEVNGTWGQAIEVPGTAALNTGGDAQVISVSCASAGNCVAGGHYYDGSVFPAFVVSEVNGTWGQAIEVPGTAALNTGGAAQVNSVSCMAAGNCTVGGYYRDSSNHLQAFVASQVNGTWGQAIEVPGTAALNSLGQAQVNSVSCGSAGNCAAGGQYIDSAGHEQAFVASQVNGIWGQAIKVPGTAALNTGGIAQVNSVSCAPAGSCTAGGFYADSSVNNQAFVASQP